MGIAVYQHSTSDMRGGSDEGISQRQPTGRAATDDEGRPTNRSIYRHDVGEEQLIAVQDIHDFLFGRAKVLHPATELGQRDASHQQFHSVGLQQHLHAFPAGLLAVMGQ